MWRPGLIAVLAAATETGPPGSGDQLTIILGGIATAFIAGVVTIVVTVINARSNRTDRTSPEPPVIDTTGLHEDIAVLRFRADDADESREIVDRRLDQIERHLDIDNVRWRHDDR